MKMYEKETSIGKFANDHIDFLLEGDYDGLRWREIGRASCRERV